MKSLSASFLIALVALAPLAASSAGEKTLQNLKGTVTYGAAQNPTTPLAVKANTTINDNDWAQTGPDSLATITLPDSSQIEMASNSDVHMVSFNQTDIAHARFVVVGKMRFTVNHPAGAQADYQFQTSTGQIAVRGTVGDIFAAQSVGGAPAGLQVNVYALSSANLPVQVTLVNGQVFTLAAGQSLVVTSAAGALVGSVGAVSQSAFAPFSELGAPANAGSLGITGATGASTGAAAGAGAAGGATTGIAAGAAAAGAAAAAVAGSSGSTPAPPATAAPSPAPSTTSVPITVNKAPPVPPMPLPGVRRTPQPVR
ncbi:MAG TPA: FecR family protein [Candidatus Acidoferrales bacterium]|nr:FecR family protein [Candidatus Acidoferrales bacterium]